MQGKLLAILLTLGLVLFAGSPTLWAADCNCENKTYTLDADFDEGTLVNVNHEDPNNDQLQLDSEANPFGFIWVAVSSVGTVVKIDTETGAILGEFRTTPSSHGLGNPSRTTVDNDGSVWVANRNNVSNGFGSIVHIGLLENGQCEDRNNNGVIDTSTGGLGDVKAWTDASGTRGVGTADDECIVHYTQVNSQGTRHLSIDANNDVWVGGLNLQNFDLITGGRYDVPGSGQIIRSETSVNYGGYGGLMDPNGVIWSARNLLRWDVANPLSGSNGDPGGPSIGPPADGTNWSGQDGDSYGLCIDSQGNVWNTQLSGNLINKYAPDGTWLGGFAHGFNNAQGCVVDVNDEVWVAHSLFGGSNTVGHLLNDGTYIGNVTLDPAVEARATGVAVDKAGKIWATGYNSRKVYRIDPTAGPIGADGVTPVGAVDFISANLGGLLYNYSDMTGSTLIAPPDTGTWTVIYDSECSEHEWVTVKVSWNSEEPGDSSITVEVSSSDDGVTFGSPGVTTNGDPLTTVANGQFLKVVVTFERSTDDDDDGIYDSPILYDLTIECNQPPDCSQAAASIDTIWPPNHRFVDISVIDVTDPDGDPITITIDGISQDEPVDTYGDGSFTPDGHGVGTDTAQVRAERVGTKKVPGNGRVYHIAFTASDDKDGKCYGEVLVGVPHDQGQGNVPIDDGPSYDSTALSP